MSESIFQNPLISPDEDSPQIDGKKIRKVWHKDEWYFSIVNVIEWATGRDYQRAKDYWRNLKSELKKAGNQTASHICSFKMPAPDGKMRSTDFGNREQILRIVQEIPGAKTNVLKEWLAQVGAERLEQDEFNVTLVENPRYQREYNALIAEGFTPEEARQWLKARIRGKIVRIFLTEEWASRGISAPRQFARLTNETTEVALGKTATVLKRERRIKGSLRDYETAAALVKLTITEYTATVLHQHRESYGMDELSEDIQDIRPIVDAARPEIDRVFSQKPRRLPGGIRPQLPE